MAEQSPYSQVIIRSGCAADVPTLTKIYNHYVRHGAVTFDIHEFTVAERLEWFHHYAPTGRHRLLVADRDGEVLGYATSSPLRPKAAYDTSVETTVYLHPDALGQRLGENLYRRLLSDLCHEDLHRAYACISLPHPASIALHQRLGFHSVGTQHEVGRKFDRYWDVEWFELDLPWHEPPHF
ncbi:MAG: GNAT family N-acetyltransferase [Actinomycetota bacterium]